MPAIGWHHAHQLVQRNLDELDPQHLGAMLASCNRLLRTDDEHQKQCATLLKEQVLESLRRNPKRGNPAKEST